MANESFHQEWDQTTSTSGAVVAQAMPAGTTVLRCRLTISTAFQLDSIPSLGPAWAPNEMFAGIGVVTHGVTPPVVNNPLPGGATWLSAGYGHAVANNVWVIQPVAGSNYFHTHQEITRLDVEWPTFFSNADDLYVSWNWFGASYYGVGANISWHCDIWLG